MTYTLSMNPVRLYTTLFVVGVLLGSALIGFHQPLAQTAWKAHLPFLAGLLNTSDPVLAAQVGDYYFMGEHYNADRALKFYQQAEALDPRAPLTHYQLARLYFIRGNFDHAIFEIEAEKRVNPGYGKSEYMHGLILGYKGDLKGAAEHFQKFIASDSINWAGYNDLSWIYFQAGNYTAALEVANVGLGYAAQNPWLYNAKGVALLALGRKKEAHAAFTEALRYFETLTPEAWGASYPGNDPSIYRDGYNAMKAAIEENLEKSR